MRHNKSRRFPREDSKDVPLRAKPGLLTSFREFRRNVPELSGHLDVLRALRRSVNDRITPQVCDPVGTDVTATGNVPGRGIERRQRALHGVVAETLRQGVHETTHPADVSDEVRPRNPWMRG